MGNVLLGSLTDANCPNSHTGHHQRTPLGLRRLFAPRPQTPAQAEGWSNRTANKGSGLGRGQKGWGGAEGIGKGGHPWHEVPHGTCRWAGSKDMRLNCINGNLAQAWGL